MNTKMENNKDRDFKGVWLPKEIYLHPDLSWTEKILCVEIDSLDKGNGCWASNKYFADFLGLKSEAILANMISKLRKIGLVIDRSFDGRKRFISINPEFTKMLRQGSQKSEGRVNKKMNEISEKPQNNGFVKPPNDNSETLNNTSNNTSTPSAEAEKGEGLKKEPDLVPDVGDGVDSATPKKGIKVGKGHILLARHYVNYRENEGHVQYPSVEAKNRDISRFMKVASDIIKSGYTPQQAANCARWLNETSTPDKWTLETVLKKLPVFLAKNQ